MTTERKVSTILSDEGQRVSVGEFNQWMATYELKPRDVARYLKVNSATVSKYRGQGAPHVIRLAMRSFGAVAQEWESR